MKAKAAVIRIFNGHGEVLLLQRVKFPYGWCFPGGKLDADETSMQAAIRELGEETGIELCETPDFIGVCRSATGIYVDVYESIYCMDNEAFPKMGVIKLSKNEHSAYGWFKGLKKDSIPLSGNTWSFYIKKKPKPPVKRFVYSPIASLLRHLE